MTQETRYFVLAAGGTAGHLTPADALASELVRRGHIVSLLTDVRGAKIPSLFTEQEITILPTVRLSKNPLQWVKVALTLSKAIAISVRLMRKNRPEAVVGFGGYASFPALVAALILGIASVIHEQNALLGRVNRLLAPFVRAIATAYPSVKWLKAQYQQKSQLVGNPVRDQVIEAAAKPYFEAVKSGNFHVLVTGGSQGASVFASVITDAIARLDKELQQRLMIVQQCRPEDLTAVQARYQAMNIRAECHSYMIDLPDQIANAQLVIARAGAATIAELTAIGRPSLLIPLPSATDNHQYWNALSLAEQGGAVLLPEAEFTPLKLAELLISYLQDGEILALMAANAKAQARPNAAQYLADLVENLRNNYPPNMIAVPLQTPKISQVNPKPQLATELVNKGIKP